jgi:phosphatidylserine decarboxylase
MCIRDRVFCIIKKEGWLQLAMLLIGALLAGAGLAPMMNDFFKKL